MSEKTSRALSLDPVDNQRLMKLCGHFDEHLRQIEKRLNIQINNRGFSFEISGDKLAVEAASSLLHALYHNSDKECELTPEKLHLHLQESLQNLEKNHDTEKTISLTSLKLKTRNGLIQPHTENQRSYVNQVFLHDINFGIGPAGTGKTYLAVACAVAALESERVKRILLVRPAVEAGENLGFLPGDLTQKIDPYLRPLMDALHDIIGADRVAKLMERNVIELAPLAYMRGRTLNDAFIILDEAQNATHTQMKMFLTRLGFRSIAVITGDVTQIDLPSRVPSGLKQVTQILQGIPGVSFTFFDTTDVVRHPIVQKILDAYDHFEAGSK